MDAARIVADGTPQEVLVDPRQDRLRAFLARIEMKRE
jgi:ABC-type proline/glycine betaine transport system ATPase subunit